MQAYAEVMTWPYRLIIRAAEIEGQRGAERQLTRLRLSAIADGMEQGKSYVPGPDEKPTGKEGHYDPKPYLAMAEALDRAARPWEYSQDKLIARRIAEEAADFERFERDMGRLQG